MTQMSGFNSNRKSLPRRNIFHDKLGLANIVYSVAEIQQLEKAWIWILMSYQVA